MNITNPSPPFSALNRSTHLQTLKGQTFDLIVIGGGATGCGIALDAASRGMKIALIEKEDFASGTSSKSTKLIHGGLRYLKQFEFGLVRETGTERAIVHRLAPHLVLPEKMLLPITKRGTYGKWGAAFGVTVYDILAGVASEDRRKMLSKAATLREEPLLDDSVLTGSCLYAEYRTDDARLTIELIKTAANHGAVALNYCQAMGFVYDNKIVKGVQCQDLLTGDTFDIHARQVVSATGPWVDKLRDIDHSLSKKRLHLTKGVHLVFPHEKLPLNHSVYFDVPGGRMAFAIPRGRITYVGTTDTDYSGTLDRVVATKADADYLLNAVKHAFPTVELTVSDIISNWAGLRPLIHEEGKSPSELSRKDEIFQPESGLISIAGGKLTGYRKMAQRIVDLVEKRLPEKFAPCKTRHIPLTLKPFADANAVNNYIKELEPAVIALGLEAYHAWYLVTNYGRQAALMLSKMKDFQDPPAIALARSEVWFAVNHEMVNSLEDFFVRRTGCLYFEIESLRTVREAVVADFKEFLGWDEHRLAAEEKRLDDLVYDATHYYEAELMDA